MWLKHGALCSGTSLQWRGPQQLPWPPSLSWQDGEQPLVLDLGFPCLNWDPLLSRDLRSDLPHYTVSIGIQHLFFNISITYHLYILLFSFRIHLEKCSLLASFSPKKKPIAVINNDGNNLRRSHQFVFLQAANYLHGENMQYLCHTKKVEFRMNYMYWIFINMRHMWVFWLADGIYSLPVVQYWHWNISHQDFTGIFTYGQILHIHLTSWYI